MTRQQVHFFVTISYDDEIVSSEFMHDQDLVATILNRHPGIQDVLVGGFPLTSWMVMHPHTMN